MLLSCRVTVDRVDLQTHPGGFRIVVADPVGPSWAPLFWSVVASANYELVLVKLLSLARLWLITQRQNLLMGTS